MVRGKRQTKVKAKLLTQRDALPCPARRFCRGHGPSSTVDTPWGFDGDYEVAVACRNKECVCVSTYCRAESRALALDAAVRDWNRRCV
jgi:hypothetical protein